MTELRSEGRPSTGVSVGGWPRAKETAVAGNAQDATEVLKARLVEPGQGSMLQDSSGRAWRGWPWLAMVEIFGLYHKDNEKLLKCFKHGYETKFAFFKVHPDGTEDKIGKVPDRCGGTMQSAHI